MFQKDGPTFAELMRQALSSTQSGYDQIAPKFDATPFRTPEPILDAMGSIIGPVGAGLDVCCGTGAELRHLRALCTERVIGLDFSLEMLKEARRRLGDSRIELVQGDAFALPFVNELDVVTCVGAFGHIEEPDEQRFLDGIATTLRPGGRFVFATSRMPPITSSAWWFARGFNAAMRVRNALLPNPFVMYYLTFLWPTIRAKLVRSGFSPVAFEGRVAAPYDGVVIVAATKT